MDAYVDECGGKCLPILSRTSSLCDTPSLPPCPPPTPLALPNSSAGRKGRDAVLICKAKRPAHHLFISVTMTSTTGPFIKEEGCPSVLAWLLGCPSPGGIWGRKGWAVFLPLPGSPRGSALTRGMLGVYPSSFFLSRVCAWICPFAEHATAPSAPLRPPLSVPSPDRASPSLDSASAPSYSSAPGKGWIVSRGSEGHSGS